MAHRSCLLLLYFSSLAGRPQAKVADFELEHVGKGSAILIKASSKP
ncbi:hypothetical protein CLOM_g13522, partial [Closterium sp. NIES-68]